MRLRLSPALTARRIGAPKRRQNKPRSSPLSRSSDAEACRAFFRKRHCFIRAGQTSEADRPHRPQRFGAAAVSRGFREADAAAILYERPVATSGQRMKIEYEITPEDWGAFGEFHARKSPEYRRVSYFGVVVGVFVVFCGTAVAWSQIAKSPAFLAAGLALAVAWSFYWPRHLVAHARAHMTSADRPCLRGRHSMEASQDGLRAKCDVTDAMIGWVGVHDVLQTSDHIFVMLSAVQGYVIPKKRVMSGELDAFVREVERLRTGAGT
jgi:hypothetical protein